MKGISLIGMPGAGKSTIGRQLAGRLNWRFVDLDSVLEEKTGQPPAEFIKEKGERAFLELEGKLALGLDLTKIVFAPGGSIIYCQKAMEKIRRETTVFFLDWPVEEIKKRLAPNPLERGIIGLASQGIENLFTERRPLYQSWAHHTILGKNSSEQEVIVQIIFRC